MCAVECFYFAYLSDKAWCLISVLGNSIFVEMSFIIFHIYHHPSEVWHVVCRICLCWFRRISTNTSKEFHIRSYHTLVRWTGPDGSPQPAQVMPFAMKSILVGGPKAGGGWWRLGTKATSKSCATVTTSTTTSTTTARPTRHHQVETTWFSRGFL